MSCLVSDTTVTATSSTATATTHSNAAMMASIPPTAVESHKFVNRLTVVFYHTAQVAPSETTVQLTKGWLVFGNNKEFYEMTGFPEPGNSFLSIFDPVSEEFVPVLTTGGVQGDLAENPWIIIRKRELKNDDCLLLETCIESLLQTRDSLRHGGATAVNGSNMGFVSDDSDSDYDPAQEDESWSDMDVEYDSSMEGSEEDSAVETDDEDEVQVIHDLTWMSD